MSNTGKYFVEMDYRIMDHATDELLTTCRLHCHVQPPPYYTDDPQALEMHLELLAKLKMLVLVRQQVKERNTVYEECFDRTITIRGKLVSYHVVKDKE